MTRSATLQHCHSKIGGSKLSLMVMSATEPAGDPKPAGDLIGIEDVQNSLNRSRASVYRYANTDLQTLNPSFNPRKLNPEFRRDFKDPLMFHPNEVARFAKDVLRIKEVNISVLNSPHNATQQILDQILEELRLIRATLQRQSSIGRGAEGGQAWDL